MSREERRQYERMMKNMERGAALPPAARARAERNAQRRAARREPAARGRFDLRFWLRAILLAVAIGFVALSVQWSEGMPRALYAGIGVGAVALLIIIGFRLVQRRAAARS